MEKDIFKQRLKAQKAHKSQWKRTNFPKVATYKAIIHSIVGGELVHGLVEKTPQLKPSEIYSQHEIRKENGRLVFGTL